MEFLKERSIGDSLTEGSIAKGFLKFAFPIFISNLFQLLYNTVDAFIVGNFIGSTALAAVGSSGSLIVLLVSFFAGLSMGSGVVTARFFGAKDNEHLKKSVETTFLLAVFSGVMLTIVGVIFTPLFLRAMGTPPDVFDQSVSYLRTLFAGSVSLVIFNMLSGVFQSVGDSRTPMKYLIIASLVNVGLDLLFIRGLGKGVAYAGFATVLAQSISAVLSMRKLAVTEEKYRLDFKKLSFDKYIAVKILKQGIPSGVQMCVISIANVFVQANINSFGSAAMAGCGAHNKLQGFAFLPINCFTLALSTFVSQNIGAEHFSRLKKGIAFALTFSISLAELIGILFFVFAPPLVSLFSGREQVILYGVENIRYTSLFYLFLAYSHGCASIMRGYGKPMVPMAIMLGIWCFLRVGFITFALKFYRTIKIVFIAYPITWILSSLIFTFFIIREIRENNRGNVQKKNKKI